LAIELLPSEREAIESMVSATTRAEAVDPLAKLASSSSSSSTLTNSFAQQLSATIEGLLNQSGIGSAIDIKVSEVAGRNSGGSQFLVTVTPTTPSATASPAATTGTHTSSPTTPASPPVSDVPTMLGMGPVTGTAPVKQVTDPAPVAEAPVTEADAYWDAQPAAVQALRNMPDGPAKDQLALNLANQGYSIDTQIMVWGWDPQMTMTVRENQGYSWVPGYGQSNIPVGPGLSMPDNPSNYNPGNPPPGAIQVSTVFAVGTIQNPLVQTNSLSS
jgi:hypothetical protein